MGERIIASIGWLILLYWVVKNAASVNNTLNAVGNGYTATVETLQGS